MKAKTGETQDAWDPSFPSFLAAWYTADDILTLPDMCHVSGLEAYFLERPERRFLEEL